MKSRTSFFNAGVLKKDLTRFAPLWGLYTVFMLLTLFIFWILEATPDDLACTADTLMRIMVPVNFVFAGLTALLLFGDLYKNRLAYALHAMPLRREGWFFTHSVAGLLMCLVPNLLGALITIGMLGQFWYLAFLWLAVMVLEYICFFGIGAFCALCAGSSLGAVTMYGLLNFLAVLLGGLCKGFYEPVLFGVTVNLDFLSDFCPVLTLGSSSYVDVDYLTGTTAIFRGFGDGWGYCFLAAAAGLILWGLGLLIYRKRKLETAGDLISFRPARPVFLVLYTLSVAVLLYQMGIALESGELVFLLVGLALGWFTGKMLLEKRIKVFGKKSFLGFGALTVALFLSIGLAWLDPVGITRYVPAPEQVASVRISPFAADYYNAAFPIVTDQPTIQGLTQIHERLATQREEYDEESMTFQIHYTLNTGAEIARTYYLDPNSPDGQWLKTVYSRPEVILGSSDLGALKRSIRFAEVDSYRDELQSSYGTSVWTVDQDAFDGLLEALWADCQEGNLVQIWVYRDGSHQVANLNISFAGSTRYLDIYESCTHTVEFLKQQAAKQAATE